MVKPDILLAITETKLNSNTVTNSNNVTNTVNISGYSFYHACDSMTAAGGAGIYVCKNLKVIERSVLNFRWTLLNHAGLKLNLAFIKRKLS